MAKDHAQTKPTDSRPSGGPKKGFLARITGPAMRENVLSWVKLIGVFLAINWLLVQPFRIPSNSMLPTLRGGTFFGGDRVAVNKWIYGPRIPFTSKRLFRLAEPQRWDIVVFRAVKKDAEHNVLVKRIVGLPGERIHIEPGELYVNGELLEPPEDLRKDLHYTTQLTPGQADVERGVLECAKLNRIPAVLNPLSPSCQQFMADVSMLHEDVRTLDLDDLSEEETSALIERVHPTTLEVMRELLEMNYAQGHPLKYGIRTEDEHAVVPEDCYLVLGDNSGNSGDGRYFGWLPGDHIVGRVFCTWWPIGRRRDFTGFSYTWWGRVLLYGIPAVLILYDLLSSFVVRSLRVRANFLPDVVSCGDRVIVDRRAFGFRVPFVGARVPSGRTPARGEVVAYCAPKGTPDCAGAVFIGRVAGIPGDVVRVTGSGIQVGDGEAVEFAAQNDSDTSTAGCFSKGETTVPDGRYVVWANVSGELPDSRTLGWIALGDMVGRVSRVWWPLRRWQTIGPNTTGRRDGSKEE